MKISDLYKAFMVAEEGQTSAEYVGITALAVVIATTVAWLALKTALGNALESIGESIVNFLSTAS